MRGAVAVADSTSGWLIVIGGWVNPVGPTPDTRILCVFYVYDAVILVPSRRNNSVVARLRRLSTLLLVVTWLPCAPKPPVPR